MFDVKNLNLLTCLVSDDRPPSVVSDGIVIWQTSPETTPIHFSVSQPEAQKLPKKVNLGLFTDVFPLKVSHLFHTQTLSNWIVNLWWRLIIRPSSEVLMRSYFSWMTSPQITPGDSGFRVWTCFFGAFLLLARGIKMSVLCFPGAASGFKFVEGMAKVLTLCKAPSLSLSGLSHPLASHSSAKWKTLS